MTDQVAVFDREAEMSVLGAAMLSGDPRTAAALVARGLRSDHFYIEQHAAVFTALVSICDRQAGTDPVTVWAEMARLGIRANVQRYLLDETVASAPSAGNYGEYADRVMELSRWRARRTALRRMDTAASREDGAAWDKAFDDAERATEGTRTESLSPEQWGALMFDFFAQSQEEPDQRKQFAVPLPFERMNRALGGGIWPGEVMVLAGPTGVGKSIVADQIADHASDRGVSTHLYMTEMTAINRGMRLLARRTGVPFMKQRRQELSSEEYEKILAELGRMHYGCTIAAGWTVEDVVRDALRARYRLVVIDLLHGFHYEDERDLDKLSKAIQRLARVSTTLDGHPGTAVLAVAHLKEEGVRNGKIPRPTIASIKGGSSIKQDADFVAFVWQEQDDAGVFNGEAELWLAKGRSGEPIKVTLRANTRRFRFDVREPDDRPERPGPDGSW